MNVLAALGVVFLISGSSASAVGLSAFAIDLDGEESAVDRTGLVGAPNLLTTRPDPPEYAVVDSCECSAGTRTALLEIAPVASPRLLPASFDADVVLEPRFSGEGGARDHLALRAAGRDLRRDLMQMGQAVRREPAAGARPPMLREYSRP